MSTKTIFLSLCLLLLLGSRTTAQTISSKEDYSSCCGVEPVEFTLGKAYVFVPNVFSPNEDGINDLFQPFINNDAVEILDFTILTATGDSVLFQRATFNYEDTNNYGWDGNLADGSPYSGLFRYGMRLISRDGELRIVEGKACRLVCKAEANALLSRSGCFFPEQFDPQSQKLSRTKPNTESPCQAP